MSRFDLTDSGRRAPRMRRAVRMFDAARTDRLTGPWLSFPLNADDVIRRNQRILVARSREQAANNDYARAFLRMCSQNIVGPRGVQLQAQAMDADGSLDTAANDAIEAAWRAWGQAENCDVTGRLSLRAIQRQLAITAARDGEFMFRIVTGRRAGPWGIALQMIDPQLCPVDFDQASQGGGNFIRHGIEFTELGRPVAYYFVTTREEDADYNWNGRAFVRVPAGEIVHGFLADLVGQKRGLPWMATALARLRHQNEFEKAALIAAEEGAKKSGFIEWEDGYGPAAQDDEAVVIESEAGTYHELPMGARFKVNDPAYPNGEFAPFSKAMLRGASAGMGVAYNNLANDLEGVNFSSIRQGTLDEREHWKELQEWLIESAMRPIFAAWLPRALLAGRIVAKGKPLPAAKIDKFAAVEWQPRRWDWIDPNADMKAAVASKNNLLASPGQIIRDRGRDPSTVYREIARDIADMRAAGIPEDIIALAMGQKIESGGKGQKPGGQGDDREN